MEKDKGNSGRNNKLTRRTFAKVCGGVVAISALLAGGRFSASYMKPSNTFLRPPGGENEKVFFGKCIKCGQCVQVCPYHSVKLADIDRGIALGTPYINPSKRACYLCDLLPCVLSCPSGALDDNVSQPKDVRMGMAEVVSANSCFGMTGENVSENDIAKLIAHGAKSSEEKEVADKLRQFEAKKCSICADMCPYPQKEDAIGFKYNEDGTYFPEIKSKCVGCGVCMELCPAKKNVFAVKAL